MAERLLPWLRAAFLVAVVACAWLGLRGRWTEVGAALGSVSPAAVALALVLVLLGLSATGVLWLRLMTLLGAHLPAREGSAIFFVGQLGKYVPGSVWSLGAQAQLARGYAVPPRATVAAGLVFLGYHLATGVVLGALALLSGRLESPWPWWLTVVALACAVLALAPPLVRRLARRIAGRTLDLGLDDTARGLGLMLLAWSAYAAALVLLAPGTPWHLLVALGGAFTLSYAVGVVVVLAPAGVGAREGLFVVLLAPVLGVAEATAVALLARVVHTVADGLMATGWWTAAHATLGDTTHAGRGADSRHR